MTSAVTELGRLLSDRVQMVTLEATSDYWRIFYYLLEALGLAVQLCPRRRPGSSRAARKQTR